MLTYVCFGDIHQKQMNSIKFTFLTWLELSGSKAKDFTSSLSQNKKKNLMFMLISVFIFVFLPLYLVVLQWTLVILFSSVKAKVSHVHFQVVSQRFFPMPNCLLFPHFFCSLWVFFSFRIEMYLLKFAYNYICLNLSMNYAFQIVWSGLIQILSVCGFAQINDCLISQNGYFFLLWEQNMK